MHRGELVLILHAHLPYIRHPEHAEFLEERWLFEAITETYLPILQRLQRLADDGLALHLTVSLSPTLLAMLADPLLQERYVRHLERQIELAEKETVRTKWLPPFDRLARMYAGRAREAHRVYTGVYRRDLIAAFRSLHLQGGLELMTTCATHGYLPLLDRHPAAVRAQIRVGLQAFEEFMGFRPRGLWLPECGYAPGLDAILREEGVGYVIVDAHGVLFGEPRPRFGVHAPVRTPSGVIVFGRDLASSKQVWSSIEGYPGHPDYREFHRDIGYDLDTDYLRPYLGGDGSRTATGIKYYRITGATDQKEPYDPDRARAQAAAHARNFVRERDAHALRLKEVLGRGPVIVSPYDAELFGHWWFEGTDWLELVIRDVQREARDLRMTTPARVIDGAGEFQMQQPAMSSWGVRGYHDMWLNGSNDWIWPRLHRMAERMVRLTSAMPDAHGPSLRVLNQMARELLLAQASDWGFIIKTQSHASYAYGRLQDHMERFDVLADALEAQEIDESRLARFESQDNLFPFVDYRVYANLPPEPGGGFQAALASEGRRRASTPSARLASAPAANAGSEQAARPPASATPAGPGS
ncbi:MAG TPA: 1,4-alpha-glucan branching protein domain-containing protein [bacterium]